MNMDQMFEELKAILFVEGISAIEHFLGFTISKDAPLNPAMIEELLNEVYDQMPNEEFFLYCEIYGIL